MHIVEKREILSHRKKKFAGGLVRAFFDNRNKHISMQMFIVHVRKPEPAGELITCQRSRY